MFLTTGLEKSKKNWVVDYYRFDAKKFEQDLKNKTEKFWEAQGENKALEIFHQAAQRVPAYKDFLRKHKISHEKIKIINDFSRLPITDKQNYIAAYPLNARAWDGKTEESKIIASSSGTTGNSNFWPRGSFQEFEAATTHELLYKNFFEIDKYKTLFIIGFPMGVYVSGMATLLPSWLAAQKYQASIVSAGNNKAEVLKAVKNLSANFGQTVLIGHPFFIKDVIETGKSQGIKWPKIKLRLMMCSEGFSEVWREYLMDEAGIKNKLGSTLSTYGSSEMLLMAYETPFSIILKELAEQSPEAQKKLFGRIHTPSVFQYNPLLRYIESINRELIFTSNSGLPLIRFNLHDSGLTLKFSQAATALGHYRPAWQKSVKPWPLWQLPLVALWGRSDHTIIFYAANIYPEHIHTALHQKPFLKHLTGKFTMRKTSSKTMDEFLEINIELKATTKNSKDLAKNIQSSIFKKLLEVNAEFCDANSRFGNKTIPRVKLWPYQHHKYFKPGLKPKYIS